ncbi:MAG: cytochrome ubiquinol oxidase subunit I [Planctomycetota bacterium]|nr:cytochrome ubiquinol oxidase subunit I [Planctomycetota bacterium]
MDVGMLSRIQFAVTIGFHFLFPPVTIGLAWLLVIVEGLAWRTKRAEYEQAGRFFSRLLGLTFAMGVATGIVMEFQFGTNWARYSKFVGDIFGAPLAVEAVVAFFLESVFLGLYLFGRERVSKGVHWFSILMVAVGATISAFWIIAANSWMQTPAGYTIANGRAELTSFREAVFNASTMIRYHHTVTAAMVCGAFFMAGAAAYLLLREGRRGEAANAGVVGMARRALGVALVFGLVMSILTVFPFGHQHTQQVARTQPEKFAAIEGLYTSQTKAPLVMFAVPFTDPPRLKVKIELSGLLSWMAFGDVNAHVPGIDAFPADQLPPLWLTFVSFHNMVVLGVFFIGACGYGVWQMWRGKVDEKRWFLRVLVCSVPLPIAACQLGWVVAEVGRQPWIVYKVMRTSEAFSANVSAGQVLFSLVLFGLIYVGLLACYFTVLFHKLNHAGGGHVASERELPPATGSQS